MTESRLYYQFFKSNFLIILIPAILFFIIGFFYLQQQPQIIQLKRWYTLSSQDNPQQLIPVADHIVTLLRSEQLKRDLTIQSSVVIYKPSPLSFQVVLSSDKNETVQTDISTMDHYISSQFNVKKEFSDVIEVEKLNYYFPLLLGFGSGGLLGLMISLIRAYSSHH